MTQSRSTGLFGQWKKIAHAIETVRSEIKAQSQLGQLG